MSKYFSLKMKILLWLVKNKRNSKGELPIYCRITINKERAEVFTGIYVKEPDFDKKKKRIKGTDKGAETKNRVLDKLKFDISNAYFNEVLNNGREPKPWELKALISDSKGVKTSILISLLEEYAEELHKIRPNERRLKLHYRYISLLQRILKNLNKPKIQLSQCDNYFLDEMAHNIISVEGYSVGHTKKVYGFIKAAMTYAFNRKYIDRILIHDYRLPYTEKQEIVYLEEYEVNKIYNHLFSATLQPYADLFMVQCYTGLAYADLRKLNASHLVKDKNGLTWINLTRQKIETAECVIPVIGKVWKILKKYNFILPVFSNQKYNAALKKIATEVGIRKKLTTHVGRKTYGTLLLNKDVPIETVSNLLGHSSIRTTQKHYAKVLHMKIARDVRLVL